MYSYCGSIFGSESERENVGMPLLSGFVAKTGYSSSPVYRCRSIPMISRG